MQKFFMVITILLLFVSAIGVMEVRGVSVCVVVMATRVFCMAMCVHSRIVSLCIVSVHETVHLHQEAGGMLLDNFWD